MSLVSKYRMLVQARTDLTEEEIRRYEASKGPNGNSPAGWPYRDTGEIIHAQRSQSAVKFYRALKEIIPLIKIRAVKIHEPRSKRRNDDIAFRAWRGFECMCGSVNGVEDEVKHFGVSVDRTACGLHFTTTWKQNGKPDCDICLAAAVNCHQEMRQYL